MRQPVSIPYISFLRIALFAYLPIRQFPYYPIFAPCYQS
jgi:hypothetical protein